MTPARFGMDGTESPVNLKYVLILAGMLSAFTQNLEPSPERQKNLLQKDDRFI
jgi:hypothetical protein